MAMTWGYIIRFIILLDRKGLTVPTLRTDVPICKLPDTQSWASTAGSVLCLSRWENLCPRPWEVFFWILAWLAKGLIFYKRPSVPHPGVTFWIPHPYPSVVLQVRYQIGCDHNLPFTPNEHHYRQDIGAPVSLLTWVSGTISADCHLSRWELSIFISWKFTGKLYSAPAETREGGSLGIWLAFSDHSWSV